MSPLELYATDLNPGLNAQRVSRRRPALRADRAPPPRLRISATRVTAMMSDERPTLSRARPRVPGLESSYLQTRITAHRNESNSVILGVACAPLATIRPPLAHATM